MVHFRQVPGLKIRLAGKSIPLEKYAIKQCEHFFVQNWLFLPALVTTDLSRAFSCVNFSANKNLCSPENKMSSCQTVDTLFSSLLGITLSDQWILYSRS